ncbi:MAG TPA: FAD-dependent oxidoreductase [Balneolaceae bacterium]|nr:FAD-dependent oxidoreductase [Balneolaceae bacterium]
MNYDFCILGAGIAGLSLADALLEQNFTVAVLEKHDVAAGASGTPGGLVNPATGRRAKKTWKTEQCYPAIRHNLEKIQNFSSQKFFRNNGLLRPALSHKMARKMHERYEETSWPEGWCIWQSEQQIKDRHPGINCVDGGLWLPIGLTVDVGAYLHAYADFLVAKDVLIETGVEPDFHRKNNRWTVQISGTQLQCEHLVFATGFDTTHHPFWKFLPLEGVKGQVARFKAKKPLLAFDHSISSMGYIARLGKPTEFIQGSTYNHDFDDIQPDTEGVEYLRGRSRKVLPELAKNATLIDQWAGVRLNAPDRKPVLGSHPEIKNLHVFTALSSKGLMYGKFLAEHFADHFRNSTPLFPEISIERFGSA